MACFVVPLAQAVATTLYRRRLAKAETPNSKMVNPPIVNAESLQRLELMLWGGSAMLIVDHIISGEVIPYFPFFSALLTEGGALAMLREMLTVGVPMSIIVTAIWAISMISVHGTRKA